MIIEQPHSNGNTTKMVDSTRTKKSSRKRGLPRATVRRSDSDELSSSYSSARAYYSPPSMKRSVSFSEKRRIRQIPAISDMSKREINDVYYSIAECEKMKEACVRVIRKIVFRAYKHDIDGLESEWRGLEKKTREGSDRRKAYRDCSLLTVLNEQKKQRKNPSIANVETIAQKYRQTSEECKKIALQVAAYDAKIVRQKGASSKFQELKPSTFLPPMPAPVKKPTPDETSDPSTSPTPPLLPTSSSSPTLAWNMVSPHDETLSHNRLLSMMNANNALLGGSQRQLSLAV